MQDKLLIGIVMIILLRGMGSAKGYEAFLRGAKRGAESAFSLLPALCAMTLMLSLMNASGLNALLCRLISPLTRALGLPWETAVLLTLRPLTGSGSLTAMKEIFRQCGVDSRAGRVAAVLMGSSETIFYTMTVYLGATKLRKLPWALPVSLVSYLVGAWVCAMVV